jgi:hypothetical protein
MKIETNVLKLFAFNIYLPDESSSRFGIFHDLAELFGLEYNADAVKLLRKTLRASPEDSKRKVRINYEADRVSITAARPNVIFVVARTINELSLPEFFRPLDEATASQLLKALTSWKRPKPKKWGVGDVFSIELSDGTHAFGQVLAKQHGSPTCAIFEARAPQKDLDLDVVCTSRIATIARVTPDQLDKGIWAVQGRRSVHADPNSGPGGPPNQVGSLSRTANVLNNFAEAYHGLLPWNYAADEKWLDSLLMPGMERPPSAICLSPEERKQYRVAQGWEAP